MPEPTCRVCYATSLAPDERDRFYAEPVTTSIHLCDEHQRAVDDMLAAAPVMRFVKTAQPSEPLRFATSHHPRNNETTEGEGSR